jgi:hypothetical protein
MDDKQQIAANAVELGNSFRESALVYEECIAGLVERFDLLTEDLTMDQAMAIQLRARSRLESLHRPLLITAATVNRLVKKLNVVPPDPEFGPAE